MARFLRKCFGHSPYTKDDIVSAHAQHGFNVLPKSEKCSADFIFQGRATKIFFGVQKNVICEHDMCDEPCFKCPESDIISIIKNLLKF